MEYMEVMVDDTERDQFGIQLPIREDVKITKEKLYYKLIFNKKNCYVTSSRYLSVCTGSCLRPFTGGGVPIIPL